MPRSRPVTGTVTDVWYRGRWTVRGTGDWDCKSVGGSDGLLASPECLRNPHEGRLQ